MTKGDLEKIWVKLLKEILDFNGLNVNIDLQQDTMGSPNPYSQPCLVGQVLVVVNHFSRISSLIMQHFNQLFRMMIIPALSGSVISLVEH